MKAVALAFVLSLASLQLSAQLVKKPSCGTLSVDWLDGTVNGVRPDYNQARIKENLPCFESSEDESQSSTCGGIVKFKEDIRFYPSRDYAEIGEKFRGKQSFPLLNARKGTLFKFLGKPLLTDANWEAYQTAYGILIVYYKAGLVKMVRFSTKTADLIQLCE